MEPGAMPEGGLSQASHAGGAPPAAGTGPGAAVASGDTAAWQAALPALTRRPPYACPRCTGNRASFTLLWPLTWSVRKNAHTGQVEEWRAGPALATAAGGEPDLTVRCELCGFAGPESMFTAAARRLPPPFPAGPAAGG
ncbi:acyl transferase [Thermaerobacter sp. PB12/4term]|uniref:acyl transferase n=1 Tax=Thermaerobacter sp. PB12/4term TaxID=2293838 RepID=UPI000E328575|nr:acyl transferase [Thermaerobacter sp. PB12/4term]QIA27017.1 acyl transferase [Thermaerobacter sp. PB12/4term]